MGKVSLQNNFIPFFLYISSFQSFFFPNSKWLNKLIHHLNNKKVKYSSTKYYSDEKYNIQFWCFKKYQWIIMFTAWSAAAEETLSKLWQQKQEIHNRNSFAKVVYFFLAEVIKVMWRFCCQLRPQHYTQPDRNRGASVGLHKECFGKWAALEGYNKLIHLAQAGTVGLC